MKILLAVLNLLAAVPAFAQGLDCPGVSLGHDTQEVVFSRLSERGVKVESLKQTTCRDSASTLMAILPGVCTSLPAKPFGLSVTFRADSGLASVAMLSFPFNALQHEALSRKLAADFERMESSSIPWALRSGSIDQEIGGVFKGREGIVWLTKPSAGMPPPHYSQIVFALPDSVALATQDLNRCE